MDLNSSDAGDQGRIQLTSPLQDWDDRWRSFQERQQEWIGKVNRETPAYCLPGQVLDRLAMGVKQEPPILDSSSAQAEREFSSLCQQFHAVGVWHDTPVVYSYLQQTRPATPSEDMLRGCGYTTAEILQARKAIQDADEPFLRLKGYAGWLLTEPAFHDSVKKLKTRWDACKSLRETLHFPLTRPTPVAGMESLAAETVKAAGQREATFADELISFLDRWGLTCLVTWDLPEPQGPLLPNLLPEGSPAVPRHGIHIVLPLHYPLRGDDNLQKKILSFQRQKAEGLNLDKSLAGLPHHLSYGHMLEIFHIEQTVSSRYAARGRKGFISQLEDALADFLGCGRDQIQKLRKAISACLRGQRDRVKWLRLPVR